MNKFILAVVLFTIVPCFTFAHSGRTDSRGGHHDRKNGGYHYHNGGSSSGSSSTQSTGYNPYYSSRQARYTAKRDAKTESRTTARTSSKKDVSILAQKVKHKSTPAPILEDFRVWRTADEQFEVTARYRYFSQGKVAIERKDNSKVIKVKLDILSSKDKEYVAQTRERHKKR